MLAFKIVTAMAGICSLAAGVPTLCARTTSSIQSRDLPTIGDVIGNASYLLGWELVAMGGSDTNKLNSLCQLAQQRQGHWAAAGLNGDDITNTICNVASSGHIPTLDQLKDTLYTYNVKVFISQLLNAFDLSIYDSFPEGEMNALGYMCQYGLSYEFLRGFYLDPNQVLSAVCSAADLPVRPEGTENISVNATAVTNFVNDITELLGAEFQATAEIDDETSANCNSAASYNDNLGPIGINTELFDATVCYIVHPFTGSEFYNAIIAITTHAFVEEIGNVGVDFVDVADWRPYVCGHLSVGGLNSVGLNGTDIKNAICSEDS